MCPMVPSKRPLGRFAPPRGRSSCTLMVGTRFGWAVVVVLALALALRLGYVALTPGYAIVHDARDYDTHARSIAAGDGFARLGPGASRVTARPSPAGPGLHPD